MGDVVRGNSRRIYLNVTGESCIDYVDIVKNGQILARMNGPLTPIAPEGDTVRCKVKVDFGWNREEKYVHWQGKLSVDKGQMEAALMSALTPAQAIRLIILPQVVYVALPNFGNMIIALIQESSLAYLIGVVDVMGQAKIIDNMSYGAHIIEVYFAVSLLYWLLSLVTGKCVDLLSGKMGKVLG